MLWGIYCLVLYFFKIKSKIVLKEYTSNPRTCVAAYFTLFTFPLTQFTTRAHEEDFSVTVYLEWGSGSRGGKKISRVKNWTDTNQ